MIIKRINNQTLAWIIFCLAAGFGAYEYALRVMISPLTEQMLKDFNITPHGLGILSSAFFYGYVSVQIISGYLLKKYSPKRLLSAALSLCVVATFAFAHFSNFYFSFLARLIMGIGGGFAFIGAFVLVTNWFERKHWATLYGIIQFIGCMGAMYGQRFFSSLSHLFSWREMANIFGFLGVILLVLFYIFLQDKPENHKRYNIKTEHLSLFNQLAIVIRNHRSWAMASYALFTWGPITISASLWGPAFLANKLHTDIATASQIFSCVWLGVGLGSPFVGWLSHRLNKHNSLLIMCSCIGLFSTIGLLYLPTHSHTVLQVLLFGLGLATAGQPLTFVKIQEANPIKTSGAAIGFNNSAIIIGGALLQPLSSFIITRASNHDASLFFDFEAGLVLMPLCYLISLVIIVSFSTMNSHFYINHLESKS